MTTTTKRQDYLGRWLSNANPGTTAAKDYIGRNVIAADKDFLGRLLIFNNPGAWGTGAVKTAGAYVKPLTGGNTHAVFVALDPGTTHATTEPTWPTTLGATVIDNPGASSITWQCVQT